MYVPNFSFLAQFGGELCEEQTQKVRKPCQKTTSLELWGDEMGLKSRYHQNAHLGHQLKMCIPNFSFLAQFRGGIGEEQYFFEVKKGVNPYISPPNWLEGGWLFYMLYNFWFSINWLKKGKFLRFWPLSTPSPELGHNWILTQIHLYTYISNPSSNWADWLNCSDFGQYQAE